MNYKAIIFYLSLFIFPLSGLAFINILYSTYFDYFLSIESYTITFFLTLITGSFFCYYGKSSLKIRWRRKLYTIKQIPNRPWQPEVSKGYVLSTVKERRGVSV